MLRNIIEQVQLFLQNPKKVFVTCFGIFLAAIILDGTLFKIWSLNQDINKVNQDTQTVRSQMMGIQSQIRMAHNPSFIQREAQERFDLVQDGDLIFVFSSEEE